MAMRHRLTPLKMPNLIGRLNQVHYIPVYDANRGRKKQKRNYDTDWSSHSNYQPGTSRHLYETSELHDFPSTYVGVRQPLQMAKVEAKYESPVFPHANSKNVESKTIHESLKIAKPSKAQTKDTSSERGAKEKQTPREGKLVKVMAVDTTTSRRLPNSTLHLPQLMKSFLPSVNRTAKPQVTQKSSWIDLTSQKKVKQVAPTTYKVTSKEEPANKRVTLVTVNYDATPPPKLSRKPLPPLDLTPPGESKNIYKIPPTPTVWHPAESQSKKTKSSTLKNSSHHENLQKEQSSKTELKNEGLESLLDKLDKARKLNFPNDVAKGVHTSIKQSADFWESSAKRKVLKSRRRKRVESDRHFGNFKNGIILDRLPSDLIGNYQKTFQSLEYYLGRVEVANGKEEKDKVIKSVVHIPTGRKGELLYNEADSDVDEDMTSHYFMRRLGQGERQSDVKMRYNHRESDDTPPLDPLPWEEGSEKGKPRDRPIVTFADTHQSSQALRATEIQKKVKRLTINMPKVPPPSPDTQNLRPKSRGKRRRAQEQRDDCRYCGDLQKLPEIQTKLPPLKDKPSDQDNIYHFTKFDGGIETEGKLKTSLNLPKHDSKPAGKTDARNLLTERLVAAHGALKRRHKCPKKEVVIAPFKVSIEEESKSETKSGSGKQNADGNGYSRSTISKSFTFSYMASKEAKKKKKSLKSGERSHKLEEKRETKLPDICNESQKQSPEAADCGKIKSSFISSFVSVNKSKQIYEALINENQSREREKQGNSLDKATDCDDIEDRATPISAKRIKRPEQVKSQILFPDNSGHQIETKESLIAV